MVYHTTKCSKCSITGPVVGSATRPSEAFELMISGCVPLGLVRKGELALFEHSNLVLCYICLNVETQSCITCDAENVDLQPDLRCNKNTQVCQDCLLSKRTNHLNRCESDGCMTFEDFMDSCTEQFPIEEY